MAGITATTQSGVSQNKRYPYYNLCFSIEDYGAENDFSNTYLGPDKFIEMKPKITLTAQFTEDIESQSFFEWWKEYTNSGADVWIVQTYVFGEFTNFGIQQISPLEEVMDEFGMHKITFSANVLFDPSSVDNVVPVAESNTIYVKENIADNFIKLSAYDDDNDPLTYEIEVPPAHGILRGTPPSMLFTPSDGYTGQDCFSFVVKDYWSVSEPGVITLEIGEDVVPDSVFSYTVTDKIRVSGNFHYKINAEPEWTRGFGGFLTYVDNGSGVMDIQIASYDHKMDSRDDVIETCEVEAWGTRTNYDEFLKDKLNLSTFSISENAGACQGTRFTSMFQNTSINDIPSIDFSNAEYMDYCFADTQNLSYIGQITTSAKNLQGLFQNSGITKFIGLNSPSRSNYFQDMFSGCTDLICIGKIDTTAQINTTDMFAGTTISQPDSAERTAILNGSNYSDTVSCGSEISSITKTGGSSTCDITTINGSCTSTSSHKVNFSGSVGTVTYLWSISGGSITSGGTSQTVNVSRTTSGTVYLSCRITDDLGNHYSGNYSFYHSRTSSFLVLYLPYSTSQINLRTYINANNPSSKTDIYIYNNRTNCAVHSGSLSGLNVFLENNGELQGFGKGRTNTNYTSNSGLYIQSDGDLTLINNGWIRGSGGYGGLGGKGDNNTYTKYDYYTQYISNKDCYAQSNERQALYFTHGNGVKETRFYWDNKYRMIQSHSTDWYTISGLSGHYRRSSHRNTIGCSYTTYLCNIERRLTSTATRTGGSGGLGGCGRGFNRINADGTAGGGSSPSGGYSGADGGWGQTWGTKGNNGDTWSHTANGSSGYSGAPAIWGSSNLKAGSKTGNVSGAIT